jgi:hypothetical protein
MAIFYIVTATMADGEGVEEVASSEDAAVVSTSRPVSQSSKKGDQPADVDARSARPYLSAARTSHLSLATRADRNNCGPISLTH